MLVVWRIDLCTPPDLALMIAATVNLYSNSHESFKMFVQEKPPLVDVELWKVHSGLSSYASTASLTEHLLRFYFLK